MKIEKIFTADQFTPTQWDTAQDKADFANRFMAFVKSDFPQSGFTKKFYQRLSMTFGHIAHYNQEGFWQTFFTSTAQKVRFLILTMQHPCYGDPKYTYSDVEQAIQDSLLGWVEKYEQLLAQEIETAERTELARLQAKYS
jgi:hypothetical protein